MFSIYISDKHKALVGDREEKSSKQVGAAKGEGELILRANAPLQYAFTDCSHRKFSTGTDWHLVCLHLCISIISKKRIKPPNRQSGVQAQTKVMFPYCPRVSLIEDLF